MPPLADQPELPVLGPWHADEAGDGEVVGEAGQQRRLAAIPLLRWLRSHGVDRRSDLGLNAELAAGDIFLASRHCLESTIYSTEAC